MTQALARALRELDRLGDELRKQVAAREAIEVRCGVFRMREEEIAARLALLRDELLKTEKRS